MVVSRLPIWLPEEFPGLVLLSGGSVYVGCGHAYLAVSRLEECGIVVLGMEGFRTDGTSIEPLADFVADLSDIEGLWKDRIRESCGAAMRILDQWSRMSSLEFVEFVIVLPGQDMQ